MPAGASTEKALDRLRELEGTPASSESGDEVRGLLRHRSNHVVARAAKLAAAWKLEAACAELIEAFGRFMGNPSKSDPGCSAKREAVGALSALGHIDSDVYLRGVRHVQMEPVFGGREDTACALRAASGRALLLTHYPDAYHELADLLTDREPETRRLTARTLAEAGSREAELLLRVRLRTGDDDIETLAACLDGLMAIAPERSLDFVVTFLDHEDLDLMQAAALAIGQPHLSEAFSVLRDAISAAEFLGRRRLLLLPMALLRSEEAFQFLLEQANEEPRLAAACVEALAVFAQDPDKREAVRKAVYDSGESGLKPIFHRHFDAG